MSKYTLRAARVNCGLTRDEAANMLNVSARTLYSWEHGLTMPKVTQIDNICELYGVSYDDISFYRTIRFKRR